MTEPNDTFDRLCEIIDRQRVTEWQGGIHPEDVGHLANALIAAGATMRDDNQQDTNAPPTVDDALSDLSDDPDPCNPYPEGTTEHLLYAIFGACDCEIGETDE